MVDSGFKTNLFAIYVCVNCIQTVHESCLHRSKSKYRIIQGHLIQCCQAKNKNERGFGTLLRKKSLRFHDIKKNKEKLTVLKKVKKIVDHSVFLALVPITISLTETNREKHSKYPNELPFIT